MSRLRTIVLVIGFCWGAFAILRRNAEASQWNAIPGQFDQYTFTNLDLSTLPALANVDDAHARVVCRELQNRLRGHYVLELAPLRQMANAVLPRLEQKHETAAYAKWLRTRLDCFAAADDLKIAIPPLSPDVQPALQPSANPSPDAERNTWQERLKTEDSPPGAPAYVGRLKQIFVAEGTPAELVWLAEVESGFDTWARSPLGAVGLFQLMPETAKSLGLALAPWDQRFQPEKNTQAAARYLKHLYETFGDWRLAVAAYNGGEGLVGRLLVKHAAHSYDEIAADLPAETQMYVPRVEAIILQREGVALQNLNLPNAGR
jgi:membrane-bound lytic murein transglycosylase D